MLRLLLGFLLLAATVFTAAAQEERVTASHSLPSAAGPFRLAVVAQGFVFFSGQTGQDPQTQRLVAGGVAAETHRALHILQERLRASGLTLRDVVSTTVYLTNPDDYALLNQVYQQYFTSDFPARTCVFVVGLPGHAHVEITLVATRK
jgi:2-iminobutanoate/2-iminopropanoate deaminase